MYLFFDINNIKNLNIKNHFNVILVKIIKERKYSFVSFVIIHVEQSLYITCIEVNHKKKSFSYKFCNICFIKKTNMKNHIAVVPSHECNTDIQLSISKSCTKKLSESVTTKRKGVKQLTSAMKHTKEKLTVAV